MNHREMRARLISSYGPFVFFPDDPEISKLVSTRAFTHLVLGEEITLYAHPIMEEQIEEELKENYNVVYETPELKDEYFVSPYTKIGNLKFRFKNGEGILRKAMRKPFEEEIEIIKDMNEKINLSLREFWNEIAIGMHLRDAKALLEEKMLKNGIDGFQAPSIVAFGERSKYPMVNTHEGKIEKDGILYIDSTPVLQGYPMNFSRVIFTGEREEWISALNKINAMYESLINFIEPGLSCNLLDEKIRSVGNFPHYSMVPSGGFYAPFAPGNCVLEENMLATIVPSIYLREGVIRVKRNIIIMKSGVKFLV